MLSEKIGKSGCQNLKIDGARGKGRGRKTWNECVMDDMRKFGLKAIDAQYRAGCRHKGVRNV
jgi:hypothetical protein